MASELKHNTIKQETQAKQVSKVFPSVPDNILFLDSAERLTAAKASAEKGVSSAGFTTTVQPAARAAPTFLVIMALGKFHWIRRERR